MDRQEANRRQWGTNRCELKRWDRLARSELATVRQGWIGNGKVMIDWRKWGKVYRRLGLELFVREWESGEWGNEITKQKGLNIIFSVKLIVTKFIFRHYWIPLGTKNSFVAGYIHRFLLFVFSDDLFSSLFVTFSDEMVFVTNSILISTFSDESFCHKKLKLFVTK